MARKLGRHLSAVVVAALGTAGANGAWAQAADGPSVYRVWLNDSRKAHIQIGPCSDAASGPVCGRIVRLLEPKKADGSPGTQEEAVNACDVKAGRPPRKLLGMAVLTGVMVLGYVQLAVEGTGHAVGAYRPPVTSITAPVV